MERESKYQILNDFCKRLESYLVKKYKAIITIDTFDFNVEVISLKITFSNGFRFCMELKHHEILDAMYDRKIVDMIDGYILDEYTKSLYTENGLGKMYQFESKKLY
jgi:hypothetical protein